MIYIKGTKHTVDSAPARTAAMNQLTTKRFTVKTERVTKSKDELRLNYASKINIFYTQDSGEVVVSISDTVRKIFHDHGCALASIWVSQTNGRSYSHRILFVRSDNTNKVVTQTPFSESTQNEIISLVDSEGKDPKASYEIYEEIIISAAKTGAFDILSSTNKSVTIVPHFSVIQTRANIELEKLRDQLRESISDDKGDNKKQDTFCVTYAHIKLLDVLYEKDVIGTIKDAKKDTALKQQFYNKLKERTGLNEEAQQAVQMLNAEYPEVDPFLAICARVFANFLLTLSLKVVNSKEKTPEKDAERLTFVKMHESRPLFKEDLPAFLQIETQNDLVNFLQNQLASNTDLTAKIFNKESTLNHIRNEAYNNIPFGFNPNAIVSATETTINFNEITPVVTDMTHETPQTATTKRFAVEKKRIEIPKNRRHEFANVIDLKYNPVEKNLIVTISEKVKSTFETHGCTIVNFTTTTKKNGHQLMFARNNDTNVFSQTDQNKIISVIDSEADDTKAPDNIAAVILAAAKTGVFDALQEQNQSVTMVPRYSVIQKRASNELDDLDKELKDGLSESIKEFDIFCATYAKIKLLDTLLQTDVTGVIKATKKNTQVKNDFYETLKEESRLVPENLDAQNKAYDPFLAICARAFSYFLLNLSLRVVETPGETPKTLLKDFNHKQNVFVEIKSFILNNTSKPIHQEDVEPFTAIKDEQSLIAFLKEQLSEENFTILYSVFTNTSSLNLSDDIYNNIPFGFNPNAIVNATQTTINFNKITPVVTDITHKTPQTELTKLLNNKSIYAFVYEPGTPAAPPPP